mmetsp:Transcript_105180/g.303372  ORF Transcript_105180/g.303372 Transcript_105180/m.303372 type:complete len:478 (-) Transcript_105180:52-1485(-)
MPTHTCTRRMLSAQVEYGDIPNISVTSTPSSDSATEAPPVAADHLLPLGLFDASVNDNFGCKGLSAVPSSLHAKKLLNTSSGYLCHSLMDINTNGYVTPCELQSALSTLGLNLSDLQIDVLLERYDDAPRNGLFERNELLPFFDHLKLHCAVGSAAKVIRGVEAHAFFMKIGAVSSGRSLDAVEADHNLIQKVEGKCSKYLSYSLFDKNGNGFITGEELKSGLRALAAIDVTDEQISQLIARYDDNKNGVLEPNEIVPMFDDILKYKSISATLKADSYERVFGACAKYLTYASFEKCDDGFITPEELQAGLAKLGAVPTVAADGSRWDLTDAEIDEIVARYDDNNNNVLEPEEVAVFIDDVFAAGSIDALLATPRGTMTCASAADSAANMPWQVNHKLLSYSSAYLTHSLLDSNSNGYVNSCELKAGLSTLGVRMSDRQFEKLADRYDENRNALFEREELEPLFDDLKIHILLCGYP